MEKFIDYLDISSYLCDGFKKVCDVRINNNIWYYENIDTELMFSDHCSWIYAIVDQNTIIKIGETSRPLGILPKSKKTSIDIQPLTGSKSRLGRYRSGD